jgi:FMN-dependent NADH-azoreductase
VKILHLDSSILGAASASRSLSASVVEELRRHHPDATVTHRDLTIETIPHLTGAIAAGFRDTGIKDFDAATRAEHARSKALVEEFLASDIIVIGAPMNNFSVPSQLKAWIDRVAQAGRTFRYTENGPVGLSGGRRVVVASTRGGMYSAGPGAVMDFQEAYLKAVFAFLGITDVNFVRAERLTKGGEIRTQSLEAAQAAVANSVKPSEAA